MGHEQHIIGRHSRITKTHTHTHARTTIVTPLQKGALSTLHWGAYKSQGHVPCWTLPPMMCAQTHTMGGTPALHEKVSADTR